MKYKVTNVSISLIEDETLVAGSVGLHSAEFEFDASWDEYKGEGASIIAVFSGDNDEREQIITDGKCDIPWEVLKDKGSIRVGVYGKTADKIRPTLWASPKAVREGAEPAEASAEPTPDKWQQLLDELRRIAGADPEVIGRYVNEYLAENPPADGEDGEDGTTPHIGENGNWYIGEVDTGVCAEGKDYIITDADKAEIVDSVLAALPDGDEVSY